MPVAPSIYEGDVTLSTWTCILQYPASNAFLAMVPKASPEIAIYIPSRFTTPGRKSCFCSLYLSSVFICFSLFTNLWSICFPLSENLDRPIEHTKTAFHMCNTASSLFFNLGSVHVFGRKILFSGGIHFPGVWLFRSQVNCFSA